MEVTLIGYLFIPLGCAIGLAFPSLLLPLAIFATVFQASSVINIGQLGFSPYYFVTLLIAIRFFWIMVRSKGIVAVPHKIRPLLSFWIWALISAGLLPYIFKGTPVTDPRGGIESVVAPLIPLNWTLGNVAQCGYLTLNIISVLYASTLKPDARASKALKYGILFSIVVIVVQLASVHFGFSIPFDVLNNNPGYYHATINEFMGVTRPAGTFAEPSVAGAVFAALLTGALAAFLAGEAPMWQILLYAVISLVISSGSGLAGIGLMCVALLVAYRPFKITAILKSRLRRWLVLGFFSAIGVAAVLLNASTMRALTSNTVEKQESFSFAMRTAADLFGIQLIAKTVGVGVGLGSVRMSSFLITLVATTGVLGLTLFAWSILRISRETPVSFLKWSLAGLLCTMAIGVPDLSLTVLWALILACVSCTSTMPSLSRDFCPTL